jgi:predicted nucleic acid-binding protein
VSTALVVDASIGVQIVVEERASEAVKTLLGERRDWHPLIAPSIVVSETVAAITKKVRRKEPDSVLARSAFLAWQDIVTGGLFVLTPANDLLDAAFELSLRLHHPLHDCIYLALAEAQTAAIATCDDALARKAREIGIAVEMITA